MREDSSFSAVKQIGVGDLSFEIGKSNLCKGGLAWIVSRYPLKIDGCVNFLLEERNCSFL